MNFEIKLRIKTKKLDVELNQDEAKELYEELKKLFGEILVPYYYYPNCYTYYIGDPPFNPSITGNIIHSDSTLKENSE